MSYCKPIVLKSNVRIISGMWRDIPDFDSSFFSLGLNVGVIGLKIADENSSLNIENHSYR